MREIVTTAETDRPRGDEEVQTGDTQTEGGTGSRRARDTRTGRRETIPLISKGSRQVTRMSDIFDTFEIFSDVHWT